MTSPAVRRRTRPIGVLHRDCPPLRSGESQTVPISAGMYAEDRDTSETVWKLSPEDDWVPTEVSYEAADMAIWRERLFGLMVVLVGALVMVPVAYILFSGPGSLAFVGRMVVVTGVLGPASWWARRHIPLRSST